MKEVFIETKFTDRVLTVINQANSIIDEYTVMGFDLSVRQLFYQFVSRNIFVNTPENYMSLADVVRKAREAGLIDWDTIKDRGRVTNTVPTAGSLRYYLQSLNKSFRLDKWKEQQVYIECMCEKQALEGVLLPVCERWEVPFTSNKGYSSASSLYERAKYIQSKRDVEGKKVCVLVLGDHDPSGLDMTRDIEERLTLFSDGPVDVQRLALNFDQVQRLNPPENPVKMKDSRSDDYVSKYGMSSWELDALNPATLASVVEHAIKQRLDLKLWDQMVEEETRQKDNLQDIIDDMGG